MSNSKIHAKAVLEGLSKAGAQMAKPAALITERKDDLHMRVDDLIYGFAHMINETDFDDRLMISREKTHTAVYLEVHDREDKLLFGVKLEAVKNQGSSVERHRINGFDLFFADKDAHRNKKNKPYSAEKHKPCGAEKDEPYGTEPIATLPCGDDRMYRCVLAEIKVRIDEMLKDQKLGRFTSVENLRRMPVFSLAI